MTTETASTEAGEGEATRADEPSWIDYGSTGVEEDELRCARCCQELPEDIADREAFADPEVRCGPGCCEPAPSDYASRQPAEARVESLQAAADRLYNAAWMYRHAVDPEAHKAELDAAGEAYAPFRVALHPLQRDEPATRGDDDE